MAAGDVARILYNPGRIVVDPTDLSAAYPYGGTEVGKANLCAFVPLGEGFRILSEGRGEATDTLEPSHDWRFVCFMRGWDDDAVAQFFSKHRTAGSVTQHSLFSVPGTKTPGESALGRAVILLFVPDDLTHGEAGIVYRGVPEWTEGAELALQRGTELGLPVTVDCFRDSNDNILRIGRFADLTLT